MQVIQQIQSKYRTFILNDSKTWKEITIDSIHNSAIKVQVIYTATIEIKQT